MLETAKNRGFSPHYVIFDSWYSSIENLKAVTKNGWKFIAQAEIKSSRLTNSRYLCSGIRVGVDFHTSPQRVAVGVRVCENR